MLFLLFALLVLQHLLFVGWVDGVRDGLAEVSHVLHLIALWRLDVQLHRRGIVVELRNDHGLVTRLVEAFDGGVRGLLNRALISIVWLDHLI